jgi:hypothetical protein
MGSPQPDSAFTTYLPSVRLETAPLSSATQSRGNPTCRLTAGIREVFLDSSVAQPPAATATHPLSLPDGRLNVGTHLPLLYNRYRYLGHLGEGVSAQVLLVDDTYRPEQLVTIKAMRRQYAYAGQRVGLCHMYRTVDN